MPPAFEHDPALEWLPFSSDHDTIVLAPCARIMFAPVKFQTVQFQCLQRDEQILRPLVTVAAFLEPMVNKKIIEDRRAKHSVLSPQLADSCVSTICEELCLSAVHSRRKRCKSIGQRLCIG